MTKRKNFMTPMEAWAAGQALVIWPDIQGAPLKSFVVAGYSRLPKADIWFRDNGENPPGSPTAQRLEGHAKRYRPGAWRVGRAVIEAVERGAQAERARKVHAHQQSNGIHPVAINLVARRLFGDGTG